MDNRFNIDKLIRPNIMAMSPYSSARDEFEGAGKVFLDANENSLGSILPGEYNRYPDPRQNKLRERLAKIKGLNKNQIFFGNGSDEAIDLLFRVFCEPEKDKAVILPPTYGMYKVQANINNTPVLEIPLNPDFSLPVEKIKQIINPSVKLLFICSPNNPTGNLIPKKDILEVLSAFKGLVVVDEAYIDFAPGDASMINEIKNYPNLVVLQTFSKAWGLAALRLGMAFAQNNIIEVLNKVKYPYNVNILTQEQALLALEKLEQKQAMVDELMLLRNQLIEELQALDMVKTIYPSAANFILVRVTQAQQIYQDLIKMGIVVRNRSNVFLCQNCLRITVGNKSENKMLIEAMKKIVIKEPAKLKL